MNRILSIFILTLASGCFDSLVSDPCIAGFELEGGRCIARTTPPDGGIDTPDAPTPDAPTPDGPLADAGTDGMPPDAPPPGDAGPDAPACGDTTSDPNNCGACGNVCPTGLCSASVCVGALPGHVVAIGHDYATYHPVMARVLGNALALAPDDDLAIARYPGAGQVSITVDNALHAATATVGRAWHTVPLTTSLAGVDVVVIEPQSGDGDAAATGGAAWATALDAFVDRGGVVVALQGQGGVTYRFGEAAQLFTAGAPVTATGAHVVVVAPADAVAQQVLSPYVGAASTVTWPGLSPAVMASDGETVVYHHARYASP